MGWRPASGFAQTSMGGQAPRGPLSLELYLDSSVYLVDQPILMFACVRNHGSVPFTDLASLAPFEGSLRLRLEKHGHGEMVPAFRSEILRGSGPAGLTVTAG